MKNLIAYCGNDCSECDAYKATQNNDMALREKTAREWTELYESEFTPEMINCNSCRDSASLFGYCSSCKKRSCAIEKSVESCLVCAESKTCKIFQDFVAWVPGVAKNQMKKFEKVLNFKN